MKINRKYIFVTLLLLFIEIFIALFIRDKFIRPFVGDALVAMLIFAFVRIFYNGKRIKLSIIVLSFCFAVEISQYFNLISVLGLEQNRLAVIILGATFDWLDLLAYIFGIILSFFLDKKLTIR